MLGKKIKIKDVQKFLSENPNFFVEQPQILEVLKFPPLKKNKNLGNKVVSFKDWLINNLRFEKEGLIENAKYNYLTQKKIHQAVISIINKNDLTEFFNYLNNELPRLFRLEKVNVVERSEFLSSLLEAQIELIEVEQRIRGRVRKQMEKSQKEYFLNEQIKAAQKELGDISDEKSELDELQKKIEETKLSKEALEKVNTEFTKLRQNNI